MTMFELAVSTRNQAVLAATTWQQRDAAWQQFETDWLEAFKASAAGRELDRLLDMGRKLASCDSATSDESRSFKLRMTLRGYCIRAARVARTSQFDTLFWNASTGDARDRAAMWRAAAGLPWKDLLGLPG